MAKDDSLKRLGGGGWQTRDGRFTIQSDSGRWSVVDAERTDDLGLPLVRGPFGSLTEAKAALDEARGDAAASPLAKRLADAKARSGGAKRPAAKDDSDGRPKGRRGGTGPATPPAPPEPMWLAALDPDEKARAKRLIDALGELELPEPDDIVREDVRGKVPVVARAVLVRRLALVAQDVAGKDAGEDELAAAAKVVGTVVEWLSNRGREPGPRLALPGWRLVEEGDAARRIEISRADVERAVRRAARD